MLYNQSWQMPSLEGFISWLETKDPEDTFDYYNCQGKCATDQYFASLGIILAFANKKYEPVWDRLNYISCGHTTFGEVLSEARRALNDDER